MQRSSLTRPRPLVAVMLMFVVFGGCRPDEDETELPPPLVDEEVIDDNRNEEGVGTVTVELEDGIGIYIFDGNAFPIDVRPRPIEGEVVHWQRHTVELPDGSSEERWIVVTASGESDRRRTTVIIFGPSPTPPGLEELNRHTHDGAWERSILNETDFEKTFLFGDDGWLQLDLDDGSAIATSDAATDGEIVSIELVDRYIVVIEEWSSDTEIRFRLRVFSPDGAVVATVVMPGTYVTSTTDGRDIKAVVSRHNGTVFQDLIQVSTGTRITQQAGNGINGTHAHLQYDPAGNGRFIEIVYNSDRDDTELRVMDSGGNVLATHILPGKFRRAVRTGTPPDLYKVIATEKFGRAAATVVDLTTAGAGSITQGNGPFGGLTLGSGGVTLLSGGQSLPVTIP